LCNRGFPLRYPPYRVLSVCIFTMLTFSAFVRLGIASKPCSPDGDMRVVYVLICYCPLLCGLLILVVLHLRECCAIVGMNSVNSNNKSKALVICEIYHLITKRIRENRNAARVEWNMAECNNGEVSQWSHKRLFLYSRSTQILKWSRNHFKITGSRRVIWNKLYTDGSKILGAFIRNFVRRATSRAEFTPAL
jgi:hypothetical protein